MKEKNKKIFQIFVLAIAMSFFLFVPITSKAADTSFLKTIAMRTKPPVGKLSSDSTLDKYLELQKEQDQLLMDNLIKSLPQSQASICPVNSYYDNSVNKCRCSDGYTVLDTQCITEQEWCRSKYGVFMNFNTEKGICECINGYIWNGNQCITYTQSCQDMNNNDPNIIGTKDENGIINCNCISGYVWNGNQCITYTQNCQDNYGSNSYGDGQYCYCSLGYEFDIDKTTCKSILCPKNSVKINNICVCNEGYIMRDDNCITYTEDCIQTFGSHVYGTKGNNNIFCNCESGYEWNLSKTVCVKKVENIKEGQQNIQNQTEQGNEVTKKEDNITNNQKRVDFKESISTFLANISNIFKNFFYRIFH